MTIYRNKFNKNGKDIQSLNLDLDLKWVENKIISILFGDVKTLGVIF